MTDDTHTHYISQIVQKEFGTEAGEVTRMPTGICNDVYLVAVAGSEYILRLNAEPRFMIGSQKHIPLLRSKGIAVPEIVAEDYSMSWLPVAYQIQSRIVGRDIGDVIDTLSDTELRAIAAEIANIFRQLGDVPNNGKFGVLWGDDRDLVDSWSAEVERVTRVVTGWGKTTGVLDREIEEMLNTIGNEYKEYFDSIRPQTYFGDISSKNVMVHDGRFAGLVDLDSLAQGDPLEAIGRIKASWYGTHPGEVYTTAIMDELGLAPDSQKIVTMYALLNRIFRTLENGVRFNRNSRGVVDREKMAADKAAVRALFAELTAVDKPPPAHIEETAPPLPTTDAIPVLISEPPLPAHIEPVTSEPPKVPLVDSTLSGSPPRTPSQKIILEASGLSKTYVSDGIGFDAVKDVELRVHQGDCIAIVGKSGSGKSTLMHLLACLDVPTQGYVYVDGDETSTMSESEKNRLRNEKFGFVFQQFFLNGRESVYENVALPLRIRGTGDYDMATEVQDSLQAVALTEKISKKAKDLSGGEKQRVCIARALVGKPQVIFADEPTGNLDSNTGAAVEKLLFDLNREKGITLVIVTHDADLANHCSRIVEMKDGRIVAERALEASSI